MRQDGVPRGGAFVRAIAGMFVLGCCATLAAQTPPVSSQQTSPPATGTAAQPARTPRENQEMQADLFVVRKQFSDAVPIYLELLKKEPRNALLLIKLGKAYQQQGILNQARKYYERAVKADKTNASAVNNIGTVYYQQRKYRKAIQEYRKAIALDPQIAVLHSNLGIAYYMDTQYEEAMQSFRRALEIDPNVFEQRGDPAGYLLQDRSVVNRGLFYFYLAKSYAQMSNAERCAHYLRKARDEGYAGLSAAQTDPAFAGVLKDPDVREMLGLPPLPGKSAKEPPPGA